MAVLLAGCSPGTDTPPVQPASPSVGPASVPATASAVPTFTEPSRSETSSPEPTPSLPAVFEITSPLLDGGAAAVVEQLHELSGLRPALKLDVTTEEVTLIVLDRDKQARGYRWRDGIIEPAETDVQYLGQTIFWPTDFTLENVQLIFDNAALLGTSSNGQVLQVVEYRPGKVFMSVTTTPETTTIFFRRDGSVFASLGTSAVADIREGISDVTEGSRDVTMIGFKADVGYYAEVPVTGDFIERRSRAGNRPTYVSQRSGTSSLEPFAPELIDAAALAQAIASHDTGAGCGVEIDNRFDRVQPVVTYTCDAETFHSDLQGRDLTAQLR